MTSTHVPLSQCFPEHSGQTHTLAVIDVSRHAEDGFQAAA